jgi:16S rRNA (guanine527-N7)-methyltransferase
VVSRETPGPAPLLPDWLTPYAPALSTFAALLADDGVTKGLIGPREVPRLWERHLLNCAVVAEPTIEPLLRRSTFLTEASVALGLGGRATVWRGRAEDAPQEPAAHGFDVVTARAVAPMDRLIGWTVPLLRSGGRLVALKGSNAARELAESRDAARAAGLTDLAVTEVGRGVVDPVTTVITGVRGAAQ